MYVWEQGVYGNLYSSLTFAVNLKLYLHLYIFYIIYIFFFLKKPNTKEDMLDNLTHMEHRADKTNHGDTSQNNGYP